MLIRVPAIRFISKNVQLKRCYIHDFDSALDCKHIALQACDYPTPFRGSKLFAHPEDYKKSNKCIKPEVFLFKGSGSRGRLFLRTSIFVNKATDGTPIYTNATFFVDSSACAGLTLCEELHDILRVRIIQKCSCDCVETKIGDNNHHFLVTTSHDTNKPVNLIGLPAFFALGFKFNACDICDLPQDQDRIVRGMVETETFDFL